ncbi:MAG: glycosyltransferase [Candidatus Methylacidiphilales bacterium]|nr:glycosyltransferase [Candidatus Methylacidiphilales bacterium]
MEQIRYTFIIPAPDFETALPAVNRLKALELKADRTVVGDTEIIVTVGRSPSTQRNVAAAQARGDVLVFLDSDSQPADDFLSVLAASEPFDVLGGPAMLLQPAPFLQRLFHEVLAHPYIVGPTAARYRPLGKLRETNESELILCNLAITRSCFEKVGPFNVNLYPNEENDWLDRAAGLYKAPKRHAAHPLQPVPATPLRILYQPALHIRRPQRGTWREFCTTMMRYGTGRTRQFLSSGKWNPAKQGLLIGLLLFSISLIARPLITLAALLAIGAAATGAIMVTREPYQDTTPEEKAHPPIASWKVALTGLTVPFFYAAGQFMGFLPTFQPAMKNRKPADVKLFNENGSPIVVGVSSEKHDVAAAQ